MSFQETGWLLHNFFNFTRYDHPKTLLLFLLLFLLIFLLFEEFYCLISIKSFMLFNCFVSTSLF